MLQITIPGRECVIENPDGSVGFITVPETKLSLEHSLISVQKWEAKWHTQFIDPSRQRTSEESRDYIRCMVVKPNVENIDPNVFVFIPDNIMQKVINYIDDPMTGTTFSQHGNKAKPRPKKTSAEEIYWQMITLGIPFECRTWHLNQLLTLIHVCDLKNQPPKKMSQSSWDKERRALNSARRAKSGSRG